MIEMQMLVDYYVKAIKNLAFNLVMIVNMRIIREGVYRVSDYSSQIK